MRICLLGDFSGNPDEGMKNVSRNIRKRLQVNHDVLALNSRDILRQAFHVHIRAFKPEIIHYLHGPTIRSLIILKLAKLLSGNNARTVCSATKPYFSRVSRRLLPLLKPDLILTQSLIWEEFFKSKGFRIHFFPNGIDTSKFRPAAGDEKLGLREKCGISYSEFIVLHVGHIRRNRNLEIFKRIQKIPGLQVVIVGGTTNPADEALKSELIYSGCRVYHHYINDISEVYKMADLYVFPTKYNHKSLPKSYNEIGAVDLPLSVLEAMAVNLPIITTRFGGLPRLFDEKEGFYFCPNEQSIFKQVKNVVDSKGLQFVNTRVQVMPLSWTNIIQRLKNLYKNILAN